MSIPAPNHRDLAALEAEAPAEYGAWARAVRARQQRLRQQARQSYRAMEGWQIFTEKEEWAEPENAWAALCQQAGDDYEAGRFLIERLGAERFMDPTLMATIWTLRQRTIAELGLSTRPELMLLDLAVASYYNAMRIQGWIGNLALHIEHEFFGLTQDEVRRKRLDGAVNKGLQ